MDMVDYLHFTNELARPQETYRWERVSFSAPQHPDILAGSFQRRDSEARNKQKPLHTGWGGKMAA